MRKRIAAVMAALLFCMVGVACDPQADKVSSNLSKEADQFHIARRIVFFNGITDKYLLEIEGLCSLGNDDPADELTVTCKVGENQYKKHFLGLSDNVSYFVEQTEAASVSAYRYKVIFAPESIIPDVDTDTSGSPDQP